MATVSYNLYTFLVKSFHLLYFSKLWLALLNYFTVLQRPGMRWLLGNYYDVFPILMLTAAGAKCMGTVHCQKLLEVSRLACHYLCWFVLIAEP